MKKSWIPAYIGLALLLLVIVGVALASIQSFNMDKWTAVNGGGSVTGGSFALAGTTGQAATIVMAGDIYSLNGGFWGKMATPKHQVFLPALMNNSNQFNNGQLDGETKADLISLEN